MRADRGKFGSRGACSSCERYEDIALGHSQGLENGTLRYVDTEEGLRGMVAALEGVHEVAVDLEHHSFRSFLGITCLMQLSDRTTDYILDVIKLRPLIGPLLGPLFADPQVAPASCVVSRMWSRLRLD